MQMVKKIWPWLLAAILVAGAGTGWWFFSTRRSATAQTPRFLTVRVQRGDLEVRVSGTGAVEPSVEEEVRARTSGTISWISMKDGQQVKAGQVLAELEVQDLSLQIEKARLDIALQERDLAKLREEKTRDTVTSPGTGELTWKVKVGDKVQEGTVIATVQNRSQLEVTGRFTAVQIKHIKPGQKAEVFLPEFLLTIPAQVVEVSTIPRAERSGAVLYEAKAVVDNPGSLDAGIKGMLTVLTPAGEQWAVEEGIIKLPEPLDVRAPITGKVLSMQVDSGKLVSTGQVLAEVGDPDRAQQLADQIANAELRLQQARLDLADKERQQAEREKKRQILAPIDGTLVLPAKPFGIGDDVSQGTVLGTVVDYTRMQVVISVDELDISKVKQGQQVRLTSDALPGIDITGQVYSIASRGTNQNGVATFDVTVAIQPVDGLKVGMTVNADILVERRQNTLLLPIEAVQTQGGRTIVLVAGTPGPDGSPGRPRPVPVKTGAYDATRIEILEGLEEGQLVLVQSAARSVSSQPGFMGGFIPMPGMGGQRSFGGSRPQPQGGMSR